MGENNIDSSKQIKVGAIMSYLSIGFNIIVGLLYIPWMVREIGQANYGIYTLAMSVISFFVMDFGLSSAISRLITRSRAKNDEKSIQNILGITAKIYLFIAVIVAIALVVFFSLINNIFVNLSVEEIAKFKIVFCIAGLFSIISFPFIPLNSIIISYERFVFLKACDLVNRVVTMGLMIIALIMGYGLYALVLVNVLSGILIIVIKLHYIRKSIQVKINIKYKNKETLTGIFKFSVWMTIIVISQRFILTITPAVLGALSGSIAISVFAIGHVIEGYTWRFSEALNGLFLPKITRIVTESDERERITVLMIKVGRVQLFIVGIIIIGFISLGKEFIILWMGIDFQDSYYVALLLVSTGIISFTENIAYTLLIVLNKIRYRAIVYVGNAILTLFVSVLLAPKFGAIGSAIGIFVGNVVFSIIIMNIIYNRVIGLNIVRFFKECHLKMLFPMVVSLLVGFLIQESFSAPNLIYFASKAASLAVVYFLLMWVMSFNSYEKKLVKGVIFKIRKER